MSCIDEIRDYTREFEFPSQLNHLFTADEIACVAETSELNKCFEDFSTLWKLYIIHMYLECASANDAMAPTIPIAALLSADDKRSMRKTLIDTLFRHVFEASEELKRGHAERAHEITTHVLCASIHNSATLKSDDWKSPTSFGHAVRSWWNMNARTHIVVEETIKALVKVIESMRTRGTPDHLVRKEIIERYLL